MIISVFVYLERKDSLHARISASLLVKGEENTGISEEQTIPSVFFLFQKAIMEYLLRTQIIRIKKS